MGHPCCAVHDCQQPLVNVPSLLLDSPSALSAQCAVTHCDQPVRPGGRTCHKTEHKELEAAYFTRGTALFQLQKRLKNVGLIIPPDSASDPPDNDTAPHDTDGDLGTESATCAEKPGTGNRQLKAYFRKRRTHNEQLMMRPCGVVLSRATFFGSEAISAVNVRRLRS